MQQKVATRITAAALVLATCGALHPQRAEAAVTYSGRAYGAQVTLVNPQPNVLLFSDTGPLPAAGGSLSATLVSIAVGVTLQSQTVSASTSGSAGVATSNAHQQHVVAFSGQAAQLTADVVQADTRVDCSGVQGSSVVTNLTFGGTPVTVSGQPNQVVTIANVATLTINEQIHTAGSTDITVNALHLHLGTGEDVILSSAHSDVTCPTATRSSTWGRVKAIYR